MSMREYGVVDFGMIIEAELGKSICKKFEVEALYELEDENICSLSDFCGCIRKINENGSLFGEGESLTDESLYYFSTSLAPNFIKGAYSSVEEIAEEIALKAKDYLPEGYPIKDHLCFIYGTIFG